MTLRLYIIGDTLYRKQLADVRRRFPEIDAMVVHLGGTRIMGILLTMDGRQGADLVRRVDPRMTVPVHFDDYGVFRSPLSGFWADVAHRDVRSEIRSVARGERIALGSLASRRARARTDHGGERAACSTTPKRLSDRDRTRGLRRVGRPYRSSPSTRHRT